MSFDVSRKVQEIKDGTKAIAIPANFCRDFEIERGEELFWARDFFHGIEVMMLVDEKTLEKIKKKLKNGD